MGISYVQRFQAVYSPSSLPLHRTSPEAIGLELSNLLANLLALEMLRSLPLSPPFSSIVLSRDPFLYDLLTVALPTVSVPPRLSSLDFLLLEYSAFREAERELEVDDSDWCWRRDE